MRTALVRLAFAILRRQNAILWWNTAEVPGLFDPQWKGKIVFRFAEMKFYPPAPNAARTTEGGGFNFVHVCPPDCSE